MKKAIIFFAGIIWWATFAFAQESTTPIDEAKFKLIKNAVWFYSIDTKAGWSNPSDCKDSKNYNALIECTKGMKGVDGNIKKWNDVKVASLQDLEALSNKINGDIISKGKEYRENDFKEEYKKFKNKSSEIINDVTNKLTEKDLKNTSVKEEIQEQQPEDIKPKKEREATVDEDKARAEKSSNNFNIPLLLTLLIAIIALVYSVLTGISLKNEIRKLKGKINSNKDDSANWNLAQRLNSLEKEIKSFDGSIDTLREELSKKIKNIIVAQNSPVQQSVTSAQTAPPNIKSSVITKYAKYADLENGFSLNQLSDEQDEKVFEILISPNNTAKFRVVSNRNGQQLALLNTSLYFKKTCKYDSVPTSNSTITTETEGELKLQGNQWQIVNPAKINFV